MIHISSATSHSDVQCIESRMDYTSLCDEAILIPTLSSQEHFSQVYYVCELMCNLHKLAYLYTYANVQYA